jgi:hypothetical protein
MLVNSIQHNLNATKLDTALSFPAELLVEKELIHSVVSRTNSPFVIHISRFILTAQRQAQ